MDAQAFVESYEDERGSIKSTQNGRYLVYDHPEWGEAFMPRHTERSSSHNQWDLIKRHIKKETDFSVD